MPVRQKTIFSIYNPFTRDYDLVPECMEYCAKNHEDCSNSCMDNHDCVHECNIKLSGCLNVCPCQPGCPSGCEGKFLVPERLTTFNIFFP